MGVTVFNEKGENVTNTAGRIEQMAIFFCTGCNATIHTVKSSIDHIAEKGRCGPLIWNRDYRPGEGF